MEKFNWERKEELWKLNKFKDVGFKVETRRPRVESVK